MSSSQHTSSTSAHLLSESSPPFKPTAPGTLGSDPDPTAHRQGFMHRHCREYQMMERVVRDGYWEDVFNDYFSSDDDDREGGGSLCDEDSVLGERVVEDEDEAEMRDHDRINRTNFQHSAAGLFSVTRRSQQLSVNAGREMHQPCGTAEAQNRTAGQTQRDGNGSRAEEMLEVPHCGTERPGRSVSGFGMFSRTKLRFAPAQITAIKSPKAPSQQQLDFFGQSRPRPSPVSKHWSCLPVTPTREVVAPTISLTPRVQSSIAAGSSSSSAAAAKQTLPSPPDSTKRPSKGKQRAVTPGPSVPAPPPEAYVSMGKEYRIDPETGKVSVPLTNATTAMLNVGLLCINGGAGGGANALGRKRTNSNAHRDGDVSEADGDSSDVIHVRTVRRRKSNVPDDQPTRERGGPTKGSRRRRLVRRSELAITINSDSEDRPANGREFDPSGSDDEDDEDVDARPRRRRKSKRLLLQQRNGPGY